MALSQVSLAEEAITTIVFDLRKKHIPSEPS
jgi:hypothetical protein